MKLEYSSFSQPHVYVLDVCLNVHFMYMLYISDNNHYTRNIQYGKNHRKAALLTLKY